ncbi:MAG TPA: uracil-DNA glycosylase family protein [Opitutaceae bacterium]|nr:uracil-DNA glycosylase family protein [Opitutaceae bacterium]
MRHALHAITEELRRLKTAGVKTIAVSPDGVAALRALVATRARSASPSSPADDRESATAPSRRAEAHTGSPAPVSPPKAYEPPPFTARPASVGAAPEGLAPIPEGGPTVSLPEGDKASRWAALHNLVLNDVTCRAHVRPGKKVVLGVGSLEAKIMFVGEAPGAEEEVQGEPFVGPAGQLLTKMIQAMGLKREEVYIGNIMNWRPELATRGGGEQIGNRPPTEAEMRYCLPYLKAQIEVVNPELLVALGATAAQGLLGFGSFKALGDIRGRWQSFASKPLMVTYHPSYILRNQSNRSKRMIWEDLLKVMERIGLAVSDRQRGYFLDK